MNLKELCIITGTELEYGLTNTTPEKVHVSIKRGDIRVGQSCSGSAVAFGSTVAIAEKHLAWKLRRQILMVDNHNGFGAREYRIPETLVAH